VQNGYHGSFPQWQLEANPQFTNTRARMTHSGPCPFVSSLKRIDHPPEDQLLHLRPRASEDRKRRHPHGDLMTLSASRHVLKDGEDWGKVVMMASVPRTSPEATAGMWLRPYFSPEDNTLRYQTRDGSDLPYRRTLIQVNSNPRGRLLLRLAVAEGLLDRVPDDRLPSLHFNRVLEGGFVVEAKACFKKRCCFCRAVLRLHTGISLPFQFVPDVVPACGVLRYFPYIAEDGRLHLWDVDRARDVRFRLMRAKEMSKGATKEQVQKRFPSLFAFAQSEGFWRNP